MSNEHRSSGIGGSLSWILISPQGIITFIYQNWTQMLAAVWVLAVQDQWQSAMRLVNANLWVDSSLLRFAPFMNGYCRTPHLTARRVLSLGVTRTESLMVFGSSSLAPCILCIAFIKRLRLIMFLVYRPASHRIEYNKSIANRSAVSHCTPLHSSLNC